MASASTTTTSTAALVVTDPPSSSETASLSGGARPPAASTSGDEKPKGRGKIQMRRMEKESNLLVTFSKRKSGIFKKASELCRLCGVQCAVVVFSPAGKVFSFGHPSVDHVVEGYLTGNPNPIAPAAGPNLVPQNFMEVHGPRVEELDNMELADLMAALEAAKMRGKMLEDKRQERQARCWWERPVEDLNGRQLEILKHALEALNCRVSNMARLRLLPTPSTSSSGPSPLLGFGPSFHGAGGPSSAGFSRWNNVSNRGSDEAGPSGHAPRGLRKL